MVLKVMVVVKGVLADEEVLFGNRVSKKLGS